MEAGDRYYVITDLRTNEMLSDFDGQTIRFNSEEDAKHLIDGLVNFEEGNLEDYRVDCLRW